MNDQPKRSKQINLNTIVSVVVLASIAWVGKSINDGNEKLSRLSERLAIIETSNGLKVDQLNRIEAQMTHQQAQINDMAIDFARMKVGKP